MFKCKIFITGLKCFKKLMKDFYAGFLLFWISMLAELVIKHLFPYSFS